VDGNDPRSGIPAVQQLVAGSAHTACNVPRVRLGVAPTRDALHKATTRSHLPSVHAMRARFRRTSLAYSRRDNHP
jgi:hypothetical protein